ncbi:hypothetical protein D9M69_700660 [compost metagenome]
MAGAWARRYSVSAEQLADNAALMPLVWIHPVCSNGQNPESFGSIRDAADPAL